jgi:hypothetical protein
MQFSHCVKACEACSRPFSRRHKLKHISLLLPFKKKFNLHGDVCMQGGTTLQALVGFWHDVAVKAHQRDFSKRELGRAVFTPSQPGPAYPLRALTIVHLAIYDSLAGITGEGRTYVTYNRPYPKLKGVF